MPASGWNEDCTLCRFLRGAAYGGLGGGIGGFGALLLGFDQQTAVYAAVAGGFIVLAAFGRR